jgi:rRNA processing protein Gar1
MNIGVLIGVSPQHLILRTQEWEEKTETPQIGDIVYSAEKKLIGTIADIFGPVKKPFIALRIHKAQGLTLAQFQDRKGQSFYTMPSKSKKVKDIGHTRPQRSSSGARSHHPVRKNEDKNVSAMESHTSKSEHRPYQNSGAKSKSSKYDKSSGKEK